MVSVEACVEAREHSPEGYRLTLIDVITKNDDKVDVGAGRGRSRVESASGKTRKYDSVTEYFFDAGRSVTKERFGHHGSTEALLALSGGRWQLRVGVAWKSMKCTALGM